jgi:hypothetical protein
MNPGIKVISPKTELKEPPSNPPKLLFSLYYKLSDLMVIPIRVENVSTSTADNKPINTASFGNNNIDRVAENQKK